MSSTRRIYGEEAVLIESPGQITLQSPNAFLNGSALVSIKDFGQAVVLVTNQPFLSSAGAQQLSFEDESPSGLPNFIFVENRLDSTSSIPCVLLISFSGSFSNTSAIKLDIKDSGIILNSIQLNGPTVFAGVDFRSLSTTLFLPQVSLASLTFELSANAVAQPPDDIITLTDGKLTLLRLPYVSS
jgi:hypothetical protein